MDRLTITGLSKGMSNKLIRAYKLIEGKFSPSAEDMYKHSILVAALKGAKGKDRTILKLTVPLSQEALVKSARKDSVLAELLEQMSKHPEFHFHSNKNMLGA